MERYYNSSELSKILKEKIKQLGINPKIQTNPALDSILDKILPDLEQVDRQIRVNEQDGRILLSWVQNNNGISYKNSFCRNNSSFLESIKNSHIILTSILCQKHKS